MFMSTLRNLFGSSTAMAHITKQGPFHCKVMLKEAINTKYLPAES